MTDFQFPPGRLRTLDDVTFGTPTNGQVMAYDSATGKVKFVDPGSIADGAITNAKLATVATATLKGRATSGTGAPEDLTATQVRTLLDLANLYLAKTGGTLTGDLTLNPTSGDAVLSVKPTHSEDVASALRLYGHLVGGGGAFPVSIELWDTGTNARRNRFVFANGSIAMADDADVAQFSIGTAGLSGIAMPAAAAFNAWNMDPIPTGFIGDAIYRHPTKPISAPCAKSASGTLQAGTLRFSPIRAVRNFVSYQNVAFVLRYTADTNSSADGKITGITLYGSDDLDTWTTVYTDSTARTPGTANAIVAVSINAGSLVSSTAFAYYALEVGVSVRSSKCVAVLSAEVYGQ